MGVVMSKHLRRILLAAVGLGLMVEPSSALPARLGWGLHDALPGARQIGPAPVGFIGYCRDYVSGCPDTAGVAEAALAADLWLPADRGGAEITGSIVAVARTDLFKD